jgi:trimeric autotransporter adhesin
MNRKLLNILLIGAIVISSGSFMTSCSKNYDDDINSLKSQVSELATADQLKTQVATLQAAITAAQTTATAAQTAANAATTKQALTDAVTTLNTAISGKANQTDLDNLSKALTTDLTTLEAGLGQKVDITTYNAQIATLKSQTTSLSDLLTTLTNTESSDISGLKSTVTAAITTESNDIKALGTITDGLQSQITTLSSQITQIKSDDATFNTSLNKLTTEYTYLSTVVNDLIPDISNMVTAVNLIDEAEARSIGFDNNLSFIKAKVPGNSKTSFGHDSNIYTFTGGDIKGYNDSILIQVSPTTATLNLSKDSIYLYNSKGEPIGSNDDSSTPIQITGIKPYNNQSSYITSTRSIDVSKTGLYKVYLKLRDKFDPEKFASLTVSGSNNIDYCVAIKNPLTSGPDRCVVSQYGLTVSAEYANESNTLSYSINNGTTTYRLADIYNASSAANPNDLCWSSTPKIDLTGTTPDLSDERVGKPYLPAGGGQKLNINISDNNNPSILGFYVTLDDKNQSQLSSWENDFNISSPTTPDPTSLLNVTQIGTSGSITIPPKASDIIGLRVYAVNYDGTFVDPDGKAFYVSAKNVKTKEIDETIVPTSGPSWTTSIKPLPAEVNLSPLANADVTKTIGTNNNLSITFYKADGSLANITDPTNIAKYSITVTDVTVIGDNGNTPGDFQYEDSKGNLILDLPISVTKQMPTAPTDAANLQFRSNENQQNTNNYYCFLVPEGASAWPAPSSGTATATSGTMDMTNVFLFDNKPYKFSYYDTDNNSISDITYTNTTTTVKALSLIDNSTSYKTVVTYVYKNISHDNGGEYDAPVKVKDGNNGSTYDYYYTYFCDYFNTTDPGTTPSTFTKPMGWTWTTTAPKIIYNISGSIDPATILGTNFDNSDRFSKKLSYFIGSTTDIGNPYLTITGAHLISSNGSQDEYFTVDNSLNYNYVSGTTTPTVDVPSTLKITVQDCFGKSHTISLPVTVLKMRP